MPKSHIFGIVFTHFFSASCPLLSPHVPEPQPVLCLWDFPSDAPSLSPTRLWVWIRALTPPETPTKYPKPPLSKPHFYFMALKATKPCTLWMGVQLNTSNILGWRNPEGYPKKDLSAILWAGAAIWWHRTSSAKTKMCLNLSYFPPHPVWLICHYCLVIIRECS